MNFFGGGVMIFVLIGIVIYAVMVYNGLVTVKNNVAKSWANIDVLLKQRYDEIPKLIKSCEAYMQYEKGTLEKVIALRNSAQASVGVADRAAKEGQLTAALSGVFALSENYPQLKADSGFQQLRGRISEIESQIADRREFYNDSVNNYNIRIQSIPDVFLAGMLAMTEQQMFKVSEAERADVSIDIKIPS